MSEFPSDLPDTDDLRWGYGGSPHPKTQPGAGLAQVGYDINEIPASQNWNWWHDKYHEYIDWLMDQIPREFTTLKEGIVAVPDPGIFKVRPPSDGLYYRGESIFDVQGQHGAVPVADIATDGRRCYYAQNNAGTSYRVYASDPEDGSNLWTGSPQPSVQINCVAADGRWVYAGFNHDGSYNVNFYDPSDGSRDQQLNAGAGTYNCTDLDANSSSLAVAVGNYVYCYGNLGGTPSADGNYNHGAAVYAVAVDRTLAFIGGNRGTGSNDVRAIRLSDGTAKWSVQLDTSSIIVRSICTDGNYVYVGTDQFTHSGGGQVSVYCLSILTGAEVWRNDTGNDNNSLAVDDRYLYGTYHGVLECTFMDKHTGDGLASTAALRGRACDGLSLFGYDTNNIVRVASARPTMVFQAVEGTDPVRRPFYNLAIPIGVHN